MKLRFAVHQYQGVIVTDLGCLRGLSLKAFPVIFQDFQLEDCWISEMVWMVNCKMFGKTQKFGPNLFKINLFQISTDY